MKIKLYLKETKINVNCNTGCLSIIRFHQFSSMNFRAQFQIPGVGASLFSGGTVYVYILMGLYKELDVCSCWVIDSQPVVMFQEVKIKGFPRVVS